MPAQIELFRLGPIPIPARPLWGALKDHLMPCDDCYGTGHEYPEADEHGDGCPECHGDGERKWGSFYGSCQGACDECKREPVPVAAMFEGGPTGEVYVCFRCYIRLHREACGCRAFAWADAMTEADHDAAERRTP